MDIDSIIKEERRVVDVDKIELPETQEQAIGDNSEATENENIKMSLGDLAKMGVELYNVAQTAVYRRVEPAFDASLTTEEKQAIEQPLKIVLKQYNIEMSPVAGLVVTLISINIGKIVQLKMLRSELKAKADEQKETAQTDEMIEENEN